MAYEPMDYQTTEMCPIIGSAEPERTDTEMTEIESVYRAAAEESDDSDDDIPPPPPVLTRQAAVTGPPGREGISVREQELRFIEQHGLVTFCHGTIITAVLQDPDYLLAQLTYLGRR